LGLSEAKYAAMKLLIADLLVYGQAAKDYTDYEGDVILPDNITGSVILPDEADKMTLTGNADPSLCFKAATVRFDTVNKLLIKVYATVEDASLVTITVNGVSYTLSDLTYLGNGIYRIITDAITATELSKTYTVTLAYHGEVVSELTYSVNAYAYAMNNGATANAEMKALAVALYRYGISAEAYANAQ
jgi:hypothetical protein